MLREVERVIDAQAVAIEQLDEKAERMISLSVAVLGGALLILGLVVRNAGRVSPPGLPDWSLAFIGGGAALNLASLVLFLDAYVGLQAHHEVQVGPNVEWFAEKANDASWTLLEHYVSQVSGYEMYYEANLQTMRSVTRSRRWGLYALLLAVTGYGIGFIYLLYDILPT